MKKNIFNIVVIAAIIVISGIFTSCRKIDSIMLCKDWKVVSLSNKLEYNNKTFETTFDGTQKKDTYTVKDSAYSPDSTFTYVKTKTATGAIYITFHKKGSYDYTESFKDDTTGVTTNKIDDGFWYYTGPNNKSGYKLAEQLALQSNKITLNSNSGTIYTTIYDGDNTLTIYEISTLKSKKVELIMDKSEKINFIQYVTTSKLTLEPK